MRDLPLVLARAPRGPSTGHAATTRTFSDHVSTATVRAAVNVDSATVNSKQRGAPRPAGAVWLVTEGDHMRTEIRVRPLSPGGLAGTEIQRALVRGPAIALGEA